MGTILFRMIIHQLLEHDSLFPIVSKHYESLFYLTSVATVRAGDTCGYIANEVCKINLSDLYRYNEDLQDGLCDSLPAGLQLCCDYDDERK